MASRFGNGMDGKRWMSSREVILLTLCRSKARQPLYLTPSSALLVYVQDALMTPHGAKPKAMLLPPWAMRARNAISPKVLNRIEGAYFLPLLLAPHSVVASR
jgi:hypothetical protein